MTKKLNKENSMANKARFQKQKHEIKMQKFSLLNFDKKWLFDKKNTKLNAVSKLFSDNRYQIIERMISYYLKSDVRLFGDSVAILPPFFLL